MEETSIEHTFERHDVTGFPPIRATLVELGLDQDPDAGNLLASECLSLENVESLRGLTKSELRPHSVDGIDIVAFGSLARHEWTHSSDLDYLVIVAKDDVSPSLLRTVNATARHCVAELEASEPGQTGTFGSTVSSFELTSYLGLERDTNQTTTRRILVLEESISLFDDKLHYHLIDRIIARYLVEYQTPKTGVPRLLLNDVVRYWRTIAVDYQAKNWARPSDDGWGLRYLKLRITRKICFAGMLATLFIPALEGVACDSTYLSKMIDIPALARMGKLYPYLNDDGKEALRSIIKTAGWFNGKLGDKVFRMQASAVNFHEKQIAADPDFKQALALAAGLQDSLTTVFFEGNDQLRNIIIKYGIF